MATTGGPNRDQVHLPEMTAERGAGGETHPGDGARSLRTSPVRL